MAEDTDVMPRKSVKEDWDDERIQLERKNHAARERERRSKLTPKQKRLVNKKKKIWRDSLPDDRKKELKEIDKQRRQGWTPEQKQAARDRVRKWRSALTVEEKQQLSDELGTWFRTTIPGAISRLLSAAKGRATKSKLTFSLTTEDAIRFSTITRCQRTGRPFDLSFKTAKRQRSNAPSIDRIDSSKGYTSDNVQLVCWAYNAAKHSMTDDELLQFCRDVISHHKSEK